MFSIKTCNFRMKHEEALKRTGALKVSIPAAPAAGFNLLLELLGDAP